MVGTWRAISKKRGMNEAGFGSVDAVATGAFLYLIPANAVHVNRMYNTDPHFGLRGATVLVGVLIQNAERGIE